MKHISIFITVLFFFSHTIIGAGKPEASLFHGGGHERAPGRTYPAPLNRSTDPNGFVSTSTLLRKSGHTDLNNWLAGHFRPFDSLSKGVSTIKGFTTLAFQVLADGKWQNAVALDLGDFIMVQMSNEPAISDSELAKDAIYTFDTVLKKEVEELRSQDGCECTDYAHDLVPTLPHGLFTLNDKIATINHLFPQGNGGSMSSVAVHNINGSTGHVSVVTGVQVQSDGNLKVFITEKNITPCTVTARNGTMEALKIIGYFDPRYPVQSSFPNITSASNTTGKATKAFTVTINGSSFDPASVSAVILGGSFCTTFSSCVIPNGNLLDKTTSSLKVPLQLNTTGSYRLYLFNSNQGKTSFGQPITVTN